VEEEDCKERAEEEWEAWESRRLKTLPVELTLRLEQPDSLMLELAME